MTEAVIEREWVEVDPAEARPAGPLTTPPVSWGAGYKARLHASRDGNICRCWRCSGAPVSLAERGQLDRILALHLVRDMTDMERDDWLRQWYLVPSHGPEDMRALQAWMDIESRKRVPEPKYSPRRAG